MAKLYIFGIGGTGSRVIRSLTMLLAAGVDMGKFQTVIPVIIDPDKDNGDLTRTIELLKLYKSIHDGLSLGDNMQSSFFRADITTTPDVNYRLKIANVSDKSFGDFIDYYGLNNDKPNQALINLLFSEKNLNSDMQVGFKGNPNMGSVVLNDFRGDDSISSLMSNFQEEDRIFIISSIFGGTGAAGFPLLVKTFREAHSFNFANPATIEKSIIGAISVLPYFGVKLDENSEINMETFITKTKSALTYYMKNIDVNSLYYICDKLLTQYDNNEGDKDQKNMAHFVEVVSSLAIVDFVHSDDPQNEYKEFGVKEDADPLYMSHLSDATQYLLVKPMINFYLFAKYYKNHLKDTFNKAWAKDLGFSKETLNEDFYKKLTQFTDLFLDSWLQELYDNKRSFQPFNLSSSSLYESINGFTPQKPGFFDKITGKNLQGYDAIDSEVAAASEKIKNLAKNDSFIEIHWRAISNIIKTKFNI